MCTQYQCGNIIVFRIWFTTAVNEAQRQLEEGSLFLLKALHLFFAPAVPNGVLRIQLLRKGPMKRDGSRARVARSFNEGAFILFIGCRISYWKWREDKQQPRRARLCYQIGSCLVYLRFLSDIPCSPRVVNIGVGDRNK